MRGQLRIVLPGETAELILALPTFDYTREEHELLFLPTTVPIDEPDDERVFNKFLGHPDLSMRFQDASGRRWERMEKGALAESPSPTMDDIRLKALNEHVRRPMSDRRCRPTGHRRLAALRETFRPVRR
jgi:hypothetical protein